jgi:hypothetical protein
MQDVAPAAASPCGEPAAASRCVGQAGHRVRGRTAAYCGVPTLRSSQVVGGVGGRWCLPTCASEWNGGSEGGGVHFVCVCVHDCILLSSRAFGELGFIMT